MDWNKEQRIAAREEVARRLERVAQELGDLESRWSHADWPSDLLSDIGNEWPFPVALEDQVGELWGVVHRIRATNELMALEPIRMELPREEYEWLLAELDKPPKVLPRLKAMLDKYAPDDGERWRQ